MVNGLEHGWAPAAADDWILVHDAARPCLSAAICAPCSMPYALDGAGGGAVLAAPIVDTVKREHGGVRGQTVDRAGLWRALTPQVFGFAQLRHALEEAAAPASR